MKRTQYRGNCQCCGRLQAVVAGRMSKHGYTVKDGWFQGTCPGHSFAPMQIDRAVTDNTIATVRHDITQLEKLVMELTCGAIHPETCQVGPSIARKSIPWADAPSYMQQETVRVTIHKTQNRIRAGLAYIRDMEALVNRCHGTELIEVSIDRTPLAPIPIGEVRINKLGPVSVTSILGARVYWKSPSGKRGWTGTSAWRKLPTS